MQSNHRIKNRVSLIIPALLTVLLVNGCMSVRQLTYPENFTYLEHSDVTGVMHSLANSMLRLDHLIAREEENAATQTAFINELNSIEAQTSRLIGKRSDSDSELNRQSSTNHLFLDEHIDDFLSDVARAKLQVQADPPNYYVVGKLTGGCNACHRQR